jgi:hypothetical protein
MNSTWLESVGATAAFATSAANKRTMVHWNIIKSGIVVFGICCFSLATAQKSNYWQQHVSYRMNVELDAKRNRLKGTQQIDYINKSSDTLRRLFFHLYWNAFRPGSEMDDSLNGYMGSGLPDSLQGFQKVLRLKMNGKTQTLKHQGTILEVILSKTIQPGQAVQLELEFEAQVPVMQQRAGRYNEMTGVSFSVGQWYPKICAYDNRGWHSDPYIGNEFYGEWGDFDVSITLDSKYIIAATGYLQGAAKISDGKRTWHFKAPKVHDFVWAADPHYQLLTRQIVNGPLLKVYYDRDTFRLMEKFKLLPDSMQQNYGKSQHYIAEYDQRWQKVLNAVSNLFPFIESRFGKYPYRQYSFINGGDGAMEYPMATLIRNSSVSDAIHELMHTWYQGLLATNENDFPWMDEGFTTYASSIVMQYYSKHFGHSPGMPFVEEDASSSSKEEYFAQIKSGYDVALNEPANLMVSPGLYSFMAYTKGSLFLMQLGYIIGDKQRDNLLMEYYRKWSYKHPGPSDFMLLAEQLSGFKLNWYYHYFINTTSHINYGIDSVVRKGKQTMIHLRRKDNMLMPLDVLVKRKNGDSFWIYIPLDLMYGIKPTESGLERKIQPPWIFTSKDYAVKLDTPLENIASIEIDPSQRMLDIDRTDNKWIDK